MKAHGHADQTMLSVEQAQALLLAKASVMPDTDLCALDQADGRVLAQDITSPISVPGFDNSAMDGYALNWSPECGEQFAVRQRIAAGQIGQPVLLGEAARIFTGAPIPCGCNVVVPQEEVDAIDDQIHLKAAVRSGQHIRRAGEDIQAGQIVLTCGTLLQARHLGFVASIGVDRLAVYRRLRVGMFFTGDELVEPGQPLRPGTIYNSNRYALGSLVRSLGCELTDYGVVLDDPSALVQMLRKAAADNDVVITSGGVSVGEEDHVKAVVSQLGELSVWQVALKPGRPFVFGRISQADFIGLPGNPVSAFVTFMLLGRAFLIARMGRTDFEPIRMKAQAAFTWHRKGRHREFVRVRCDFDDQQNLRLALSSEHQGSGVMTSIARADGLVDIAPGTLIEPGDMVTFYPFG